VDAARLGSYLSRQLGEPAHVTGMTQAFPGLSRETWLLKIRLGSDRNGRDSGLVLRADPPGGPFVPVPLKFEWQVYEHLARTSVPVAKPLWFDPAADVADGRALFAREYVEGSTLLPGLWDDTEAAAERRRRVAIEHAETLAALHRLDWQRAGFASFMPVPQSAEAAPRAELERWRQVWEEVRTGPFPVITEVLHWFEAHLPERAAALCLCKGQNGIGEEIWRDDRIIALSDWELAHIGDP